MYCLPGGNRNVLFEEQTFCKQMDRQPEYLNQNVFDAPESLETIRPESEFVYDTLENIDNGPTRTTDGRRCCRRYIRPIGEPNTIHNERTNRDVVLNLGENQSRKPWKERSTLDRKPRKTGIMITLGFILGLVFGAITLAVLLLFIDKLNGANITCIIKQSVGTEVGQSSSSRATSPAYATTESIVTSENRTSFLPSITNGLHVSTLNSEVAGSSSESTIGEVGDSAINSTETSTVAVTSSGPTDSSTTPSTTGIQSNKRSVGEIPGGYVYTRWGSYSCPENSDQVYQGYMAGGHYKHPGGATNSICLPEVPEWGNHSDAIDVDRAPIYGTKYGSTDDTFTRLSGESLRNKDVPCTVCQATGRLSHIMIPAKTSCLENWTLEYKGYLMGSSYLHYHGSQLVCIDSTPDHVTNSDAVIGGHYLYFAEIRTGILPNPPYVNGREIPCVVCTR
ncbi:hypothetical protein ACF0H5_018975 [Mactra antiquata]